MVTTSSGWRSSLNAGRRSAGKPREVTIAADRGWQSSGVWLEAGKTYRMTARGRYQIAVEKSADVERPGRVSRAA